MFISSFKSILCSLKNVYFVSSFFEVVHFEDFSLTYRYLSLFHFILSITLVIILSLPQHYPNTSYGGIIVLELMSRIHIHCHCAINDWPKNLSSPNFDWWILPLESQ